jgi:hypothetical protein
VSGAPGVDQVHFIDTVAASTEGWANATSEVVVSLAADMKKQLREEKPFVDHILANAKTQEASSYGAVLYARAIRAKEQTTAWDYRAL